MTDKMNNPDASSGSSNKRRLQAGSRAGSTAGSRPRKAAGLIVNAARKLALAFRRTSLVAEQQRSNRAAAADMGWFSGALGARTGWASSEYGDYYTTSVSVYAAIKLRAEALGRPDLVVSRLTSQGVSVPVGPSHPAQRLLDRVNPWQTKGDLWRATEIYLNLWGSAFWALERDRNGQWEIWPLRPDRVRVLPDPATYIRGFVYQGANGPVAYTPDEIVWMRYFNPLEEFSGLSPLAPARMAVDMGKDGLKFNRNFLRNSARPDFVVLTNETMTDKEIEDFYTRWDSRFRGPDNPHRPAIANFIRDIKTLGFSHRDMDFIQGLRWSLEEVSRAFGVPKPLLSDFERATFSNVNAAERMFWRNTMVPEMKFLEEHLNRVLLPRIGYHDLIANFDLSTIESLREDESSRLARDVQLLDRGALTINEVRRSRGPGRRSLGRHRLQDHRIGWRRGQQRRPRHSRHPGLMPGGFCPVILKGLVIFQRRWIASSAPVRVDWSCAGHTSARFLAAAGTQILWLRKPLGLAVGATGRACFRSI